MRTEVDTLRVLVVSHAAVVATNQEPFHALAQAGQHVSIVAPRALDTDIRGRVELAPLAGLAADLIGLSVAVGGYKRWLGGQRGIHAIWYRNLRWAVREAAPDVIFIEEEPFSVAAWQCAREAARIHVPFVVHENQNIDRRLPPPFAQIRRFVLARAAGVTVRNRAADDVVRAAGFAGPIASFPHAVDPARYDTDARDAGLAAPVVGFVGRLVPEKGLTALIAALEGLGASLLVIGDGPERAASEAHAARLGVAARFEGAVPHDQVPSWYGAMDLVVIPSRTTPTWMEQFGRIVIEANAAGVPVIVSDSGELPHTVAATGGGLVVPEGDVAALRDALGQLLGDDARRRALGVAGRTAVEARFTPEAVARDLAAFLSEAAAR